MLAAVLAAFALPQDLPASDRFTLDGVALAAPAAVVSPLGWLEVTARRDDGKPAILKLRFPVLEWPAPGEHDLKGGVLRAWLGGTPGQDGDALAGKVTVHEVTHQRVRVALRFEQQGAPHTADVDLPATLYVPRLKPTVHSEFTPPKDAPAADDVVICAFGNGGTGLPGQRQVAESIAKLAPTGPLDCVVLLGNNFMPRGVTSEGDPLFRTRFEEVYDGKRLAVPFYAVEGPADHRGAFDASRKYGLLNQRWTSRPTGFSVEFTCRGKKLALFGGDSGWLGGSVADSRTRTALRGVFDTLRASKADWKIVCTYDQLLPLGGRNEGPLLRALEDRSRGHLVDAQVDLLLCANGPGLRYVVPKQGIPQVLSGGGGGPEMGGPVEVVEGTKFACGGGGFVWLRFDGEKLEISFRDADGKVLAVHELKKP